MEFVVCLVPLYVMHRILPFACATCIGVACYVVVRRYASRPMHSKLSCLLHKLLRALRAHCENQSFSPEELCPVASIYQNSEPHTLLLTPELHTEVAGIVDSILQGFIQPWFQPLSGVQEFPRHVEGILEDTFLELSHKLTFIHPSRALQLCLETLSGHLQHLPRCQQSSEALGPDHPAAIDRHTEWLYLESLTTCALRLVEPGDVLSSRATHMLILHLICRDVFLPLVDLISRPQVIYYLIVVLCTPPPAEIGEELDTTPSVASADDELDGVDQIAEEPSVNDLLDALVAAKKPTLSRTPRSSPMRIRASVDIERAVEADNFNDSSCLHKMNITKTESRSEHGKGVYTVYCIEYQPRLTGPTYKAKRRFNEFLNLQTALSRMGKYDQVLRGIKGPSRWLANPFMNDKKNVMNRVIYLQNYLRQLSAISDIVRTPQFQTFTGMMGDPSTFFTGGINSGHNPLRIDRMLAEGVRGALDLFKTALPNESSRDLTDGNVVSGTPTPPWFEVTLHSNIEIKYDVDAGNRKLRQAIFNYIDNFDLASSPEFSPVHSQTPLPGSKPESEEMRDFLDTESLKMAFNSSGRGSSQNSQSSTIADPLTRAILDVITVALENHQSSRFTCLLTSFEGLVGGLFEEWLNEKLEECLSPHNCATVLHRLHLLISGLAQGGEVSPSERTLEEAHEAIRNRLPPWTLAYLPVDEFILSMLESVKEERFNRALVYKLADALLDLLASVDNIEAWTR
ncbi:sorting nexin-19 [Galendromus occidentalis]|uniref:Sorting nexin-19 n=1 Tax=Galendromus occidentalis TaxID=34638 RepID=A0AAJ6VVK5_9ACAR|nr:sorting nexin-19 [Galendromus occidentalis]